MSAFKGELVLKLNVDCYKEQQWLVFGVAAHGNKTVLLQSEQAYKRNSLQHGLPPADCTRESYAATHSLLWK